MSEMTNMVTTSTPCQSQPSGKQMSAATATPSVPIDRDHVG